MGTIEKKHLENLKELGRYSINEDKFAFLIGKNEDVLFHAKEKEDLFPLSILIHGITSIVKDYYPMNSFCEYK
jgi:hypothetical protein